MRFDRSLPALVPAVSLVLAGALLASSAGCDAAAAAAPASRPADMVYRNGIIYTVDARDSVQQALAIRAGRIAYVGTDAGAAPFIAGKTRVVDLRGRLLMPGLVDGHMHPLGKLCTGSCASGK
jgi:adenine deaminase